MMRTNKIYIEVPVAQRLPEKYVDVYTNEGKAFVNEENNWRDENINDIYPVYWLEAVEVPTSDEIESHSLLQEEFCNCFDKGVEWILQKLKINQK